MSDGLFDAPDESLANLSPLNIGPGDAIGVISDDDGTTLACNTNTHINAIYRKP